MAGETIDFHFPESYTLKDMPFGALLTNVGFVEGWADHTHDDRYYTETELGSTTAPTGASLIGVDPTNIVDTAATNVQSVLEDIARRKIVEVLTPTATNTLPDLTYTPINSNTVELSVNGIVQTPGTDFTVSGKTITWSSTDFDLDTNDTVVVAYITQE